MKKNLVKCLIVAAFAILLQGCIAFPPLVQVEHKDSGSNADIAKRLDSIDKRLDRLEKQERQEIQGDKK